MGSYSKFISIKRRSVHTPASLINEDGTANFGTFQSEFKNLNLTDARRAIVLPDAFNKARLTLWEAVEIKFKEGMLLVAVSDMAIFGITKAVFFDYRSRKCYTFDNTLPSKSTKIAENLLDNHFAHAITKNSNIKMTNDFGNGKAKIEGYSKDENNRVDFNVNLTSISYPSVVSIPFGANRPLYTEKLLFKVDGEISFNGENFDLSDAYAIIDDHRGYYPRKAHYDWLCSMGRVLVNGEEVPFGFNLTRNQSIVPEDYNENLLWLSGCTSLLPPVTFTKETKTAAVLKGAVQIVHVKDEYGMVDLTYTVEATSAMITHAVVVNIDYFITFGKVNGFILDENGNKYEFKDTEAIGEDKTLLL